MAAKKRKSDLAGDQSSPSARKKRAVETPTAATGRPRRSAVAKLGEVQTEQGDGGGGGGRAVKPAKPKTESKKKAATKDKAPVDNAASAGGRPKATPSKPPAQDASPGDKTASKQKPPTQAGAAGSTHERAPGEVCYWLMKAEPESRIEKGVDVKFSIDDLEARTLPEPWDAQKNMRTMRAGDLAFFYHSNCKVPGIAGILRIVREHSVDESAFDPAHPYYDPKSSRDKPRWCVVHVEHVRTFDALVPLKELQKHAGPTAPLKDMQVLRMARLSVSRVSGKEWEFILRTLVGLEPKDVAQSK